MAAELAGCAAGAVVAPIAHDARTHEAAQAFDVVRPDLLVVESLSAQRAIIAALPQPTEILVLGGPRPNDPAGPHRVLTLETARGGAARKLERRGGPALPAAARSIQFTSGSTGTPKAIVFSEENLMSVLDREPGSHQSAKAAFCPVPQFHAMGRSVAFEHVLVGAPVHFANRFLPGSDAKRMARHRCAEIVAGPHYVRLMLRLGALSEARLPHIESITLGTAPVDADLVEEVLGRFPRCVVRRRYGVSESSGPLALSDVRTGDEIPSAGEVGHLVGGAELAPGLPMSGDGEPSEVSVKSPRNGIGQILAGGTYGPLADALGFLRTGDLGFVDARGTLHLAGRSSTFLKVNGRRVSPFEIEAVLRRPGHPPQIGPADKLLEDGRLDSIATVELISELESTYGFEVDPLEIDEEHFGSVEASRASSPRGALVVAVKAGPWPHRSHCRHMDWLDETVR